MAQFDSFDSGAAGTRLPTTFHDFAGESQKQAVDLPAHPAHPAILLGPPLATTDFLQKAIANTAQSQTVTHESSVKPEPAAKLDAAAEPGTSARPASGAKPADTVNRTEATISRLGDPEAARNKLTQEALLANPAEMRKLFPQLLKDLEVVDQQKNLNGITVPLIDQTLAAHSSQLSQTDKNLLAVFKAGHDVLCANPKEEADSKGNLEIDPNGVTEGSLALLDKAVNRGIKEDPYFRAHVLSDPVAGAVVTGAGFAISAGYTTRDWHSALLAAGSGALTGAVYAEGDLFLKKIDGDEGHMYDHVKDKYLAFESVFAKTQ